MQRPGKILIVAESIDVEDSSGAKGRVALIKNLHKAGYDLRVYHYTRREIQLENVPCFAIKEDRRSVLFFLSRAERQLRHKFNLDLHKPLENIFGFSFTLYNDRNSILEALKKINDFEPDLVLTVSKGGSFRPHHALLKLPKFYSRWIAYIHDPYPMQSYPRPYDYVEPGYWKKRNFVKHMARKCHYAAYPSKMLAEWMESYFPPLRKKGIVIPHQINEEERRDEVLPEFFKKDKFNLVCAGSLLDTRKPWPLIEAYKKFLQLCPEARAKSQLLMLGPKSVHSSKFEALKKELPAFYSSADSLPFSTVLAIQGAASVNIILEAKGPVSPFLPGKFPHCVQSDKPILLLGPYYSECRRLLGEDYPYWAEIDDIEKIQGLIGDLFFQWNNSIKGKLDRPDLKEYCSIENLKITVDSILKEI